MGNQEWTTQRHRLYWSNDTKQRQTNRTKTQHRKLSIWGTRTSLKTQHRKLSIWGTRTSLKTPEENPCV